MASEIVLWSSFDLDGLKVLLAKALSQSLSPFFQISIFSFVFFSKNNKAAPTAAERLFSADGPDLLEEARRGWRRKAFEAKTVGCFLYKSLKSVKKTIEKNGLQ